jgi:ribosome-binding factor A
METVRQKKVAEFIKTQISSLLQKNGWYTVDGGLVTITQANITPDLLEVKIYLSVYNAKSKDKVLAFFENKNAEIRHQLASKIAKQVRRIPELKFFLDDTLDEVFKLDALFKKINDEDKS